MLSFLYIITLTTMLLVHSKDYEKARKTR